MSERPRPHIVRFRVSTKELSLIKERAEAAQRTAGAYARDVVLTGQSLPARNSSQLDPRRELLIGLAKVGGLLNQLARATNIAGAISPYDRADLGAVLRETQRLLDHRRRHEATSPHAQQTPSARHRP